MDSIDIKILKLLQKNARISVSEIGSTINLSVPACSERIRKLEAAGVISQYVAIVNPASVEKNLTAIMFVSLERPQFTDKFIEFVHSEDEIMECHYLACDFDYLLKIKTKDTSTLEKLLNRLKSIHGVQKTRTIVILSSDKNNYSISL